MAYQVKTYQFNPGARTITFPNHRTIYLENIGLITNTTSGVVIFNWEDSSKKGSVSNNILTLDYNTSGMSSTDVLDIVYIPLEEAQSLSEIKNQNIVNTIFTLFKKLLQATRSLGVVDIMGRQRVAVDNTVSVLPSTYAISSFGNRLDSAAPGHGGNGTVYYQPTWAGPVDPRWTNMQNARIAYNTGIRAKLLNT